MSLSWELYQFNPLPTGDVVIEFIGICIDRCRLTAQCNGTIYSAMDRLIFRPLHRARQSLSVPSRGICIKCSNNLLPLNTSFLEFWCNIIAQCLTQIVNGAQCSQMKSKCSDYNGPLKIRLYHLVGSIHWPRISINGYLILYAELNPRNPHYLSATWEDPVPTVFCLK